MGLAIGFECPRCKKTISRQLMDLTPERQQECPECRLPVHVSGTTLQDFRRALQDYCRP